MTDRDRDLVGVILLIGFYACLVMTGYTLIIKLLGAVAP